MSCSSLEMNSLRPVYMKFQRPSWSSFVKCSAIMMKFTPELIEIAWVHGHLWKVGFSFLSF